MKRYLILLCCLPFVGSGQIITTIAGNGVNGFSGDGGLAISASLKGSYGVIVDDTGTVYFADMCNARLRAIDTFGYIKTVAGDGANAGFCNGTYSGDGGLAILASLHHPAGITFDSLGNIFIADAENERIRKIDISTGIITTVVGNGTIGFSGDGGLATLAQLSSPVDIAFDKKGNLFVVDKGNIRIRKIDQQGIIHTIAGTGVLGYNGDGGLADTSQLNEPYSIAIDDTGNVFIADIMNYRVRKIDTFGFITTIAGTGISLYNGDNIAAISANVGVSNLALDAQGNIFIADALNNRIRKITANTGIIETVAGNGTAGFSGDNGLAINAELNTPTDLGFDKLGNIYISDAQNRRIRKINLAMETLVATSTPFTFTLSPNPATAHITITANTKLKKLHLNNAVGVTVLRAESESDKVTIDVGELPAGIYFLTVYDAQGNKRTEKVIKQ